MTDFSLNKFEDIEMLEIPDDDEELTSSSETEGISDSSTSKSNPNKPFPNAQPHELFNNPKSYITIQEWLGSDATLEFQFDPSQYKDSVSLLEQPNNQYSKDYVKYVNSLYKVLEGLSDQKVTRVELEQPEQEPIGIFNEYTQSGSNEHTNQIINQAFEKILENLATLTQELSAREDSDKSEYDVIRSSELQTLVIVLECLKANWFYGETNRKPEQLVKWINSYDYKPGEDLISNVMVETPTPFLHPEFWIKLISQYLTRGLFDQAEAVLESSKYESLRDPESEDYDETSGEELHSIISDFHQLIANYTTFALKGHFDQWKLKACEFRDLLSKRKSLVTKPEHQTITRQIYDLAGIITGLPKTISNYCDEWYELFVALSLFQVRDDPSLYSEYFKLAKEEKPTLFQYPDQAEDSGPTDEAVIEDAFINILEESFLKVLEYLYKLDPFTSACISKLLELKGLLKNYYEITPTSLNFQEIIDKRTISEYFLTIQAYESLNIHDLVPIGIGLLLNEDISTSRSSHFTSKKVVQSFLPKYQCKTNDDLEWVLTICAKLNLVSTSRELYYVYGLKSLDEGLLFESLSMFVKSYDPNGILSDHTEGLKQIHYIVWDLIFQDSLVNNRPTDDILINNFVSGNIDESFEVDPIIRQTLAPYAVLYKFFTSLEEPSFKSYEASPMNKLSSLIHLLRFNHLPNKFYPLLLTQILPFLTGSEYKFQLPDLIMIIELIDTYELVRSEEDLTEGEALYKYSINHVEKNTKSYDWRKRVEGQGRKIPESIQDLVKILRSEIVSKIAQVYIK